MTLRSVKPLDDKQWTEIQANMKRGQTPEQAKRIAEAIEFCKKIHKVNF